MNEPRDAIDFRGILDVLAGQYLFYLSYKTYLLRSDFPDDSQSLALVGIAALILGGIALLIVGIRRILLSYQQSRASEQSPEAAPLQEEE